MEHLKNELLRCKAELRIAQGERYSFLYVVQQTLEWAIDPMSYSTPIDIILKDKVGTMDTPVDSKDCSAVRRLPRSLDICSHNDSSQQRH